MVKKHSQKNQQVLGNIWRVVLKTVVWGQMCIRDRNKAVESASVQLKKEKVDVKVVTRTVSSVAEVEACLLYTSQNQLACNLNSFQVGY